MGQNLRKILFVDDDEDIHFIVDLYLRDIANVELRSAYSGEEAIKIAMEFEPNLILLDVMMPKMDGISTLQVLRMIPIFTNTPIVFLTAKAQKNEIEEYYKCGATDVIVKPFDPDTFALSVEKMLKSHETS